MRTPNLDRILDPDVVLSPGFFDDLLVHPGYVSDELPSLFVGSGARDIGEPGEESVLLEVVRIALRGEVRPVLVCPRQQLPPDESPASWESDMDEWIRLAFCPYVCEFRAEFSKPFLSLFRQRASFEIRDLDLPMDVTLAGDRVALNLE